jgi:hypothetical protein
MEGRTVLFTNGALAWESKLSIFLHDRIVRFLLPALSESLLLLPARLASELARVAGRLATSSSLFYWYPGPQKVQPGKWSTGPAAKITIDNARVSP